MLRKDLLLHGTRTLVIDEDRSWLVIQYSITVVTFDQLPCQVGVKSFQDHFLQTLFGCHFGHLLSILVLRLLLLVLT